MHDDDDMPSFRPPPASRLAIGGNNPPSPIELAAEAKRRLDKFLDDHPALLTEAEAREAKLIYDLSRSSLGDLEAAQKAECGPLYAAWQAGLDKYRTPVSSFEELVTTLYQRMQKFARDLKAKRDAEAAEARRIADEARAEAIEAERKEREAKENASLGEIGAGVGQAKEEADTKFADFKEAERTARQAERDTNVRIGGGIGNAMGVRKERTLVLDSYLTAIACMGLTEDIKAAVLKSARAYKKLNGKWPDGVHEDVN